MKASSVLGRRLHHPLRNSEMQFVWPLAVRRVGGHTKKEEARRQVQIALLQDEKRLCCVRSISGFPRGKFMGVISDDQRKEMSRETEVLSVMYNFSLL